MWQILLQWQLSNLWEKFEDANYLCNQCFSPLTIWVRIPLSRSVLNTTLCLKVCQWLATGRWFSPGTLVVFCFCFFCFGESEAVNRRTKRQTIVDRTLCTQKSKYWTIWTSLKTGGELKYSGRVFFYETLEDRLGSPECLHTFFSPTLTSIPLLTSNIIENWVL